MRSLLLAALVLAASPAFAKTPKKPVAGQFCKKAKIGTTATDKAGVALECKAEGKRAKWSKK